MPRQLDDPTDALLTSLLVADGRSTLKTLAEATGLSVSAVQARVRRLETDGVIRAYSAEVDPEALGLPLAAFISLLPRDPDEEYDIPAKLADITEIASCYSVAGDVSFILFVRVASPVALETLIREIRKRANVATRTTVVLHTSFERRARPAGDAQERWQESS
jgi:Lrp/AsnC family leucine-responsive transcriptional regulator